MWEQNSATKTYTKDGIEYTASNNRQRYSAEFCEEHGKPFTEDDKAYMCSMWDSMAKSEIAYALGRTLGATLSKKWHLVKTNQFEHYKKLGKEA